MNSKIITFINSSIFCLYTYGCWILGKEFTKIKISDFKDFDSRLLSNINSK